MANKPVELMTWKDKLAKGIPLNNIEESQADADYNYRRRLREEQERKVFEAEKAGEGAQPSDTPSTEEFDDETKDEKKGK